MWLNFLYTAPIIEKQTKTLKKSFHGLDLISFKKFMELPSNLPSETVECIFHFKNQIKAIANTNTRRNMSTRFVVSLNEGLQ